jgi:hypothetical protein
VARCDLPCLPLRGVSFAPRERGEALFLHGVRLFFLAPRALSGRSLRPSRPQLRPAFACDRAGTARRADPRCSPPSQETLGRVQRLHPPDWPLGAHTLRRHGSSRPLGGSSPPPSRLPGCGTGRLARAGRWSLKGSSHRFAGGGYSTREAGASGHPSGGCGSPSGRAPTGQETRPHAVKEKLVPCPRGTKKAHAMKNTSPVALPR